MYAMEEQNVETMRMNIKLMWKTWDIRSLMIISLVIQTLLTFVAPLRKRTSSGFLSFSLWLLYLSADAVALFTIGLISSNNTGGDAYKEGLLAFWAPFLLLHLGGPDTITALALADNELWHRHALSLVTQVTITFYVFWRTFVRSSNHIVLWLPTLLMFIDGCTKYIERTCALYYASMDSFRGSLRPKPEAGPNYVRLVEEYSSASTAHIPIKIQGKDGLSGGRRSMNDDGQDESSVVEENHNEFTDDSLDDPDKIVKKVKIAYYFYNKFKGLLVDAILSLKDKHISRDVFLEKPPLEFANILLIELHIMYDIFYTKVFLIQRKYHCYARFLCFLSVTASLLLFSLEDKSKYQRVDVVITFVLLGGAIALDICGIAMFILSDWWIIVSFANDRSKIAQWIMKGLFKWTRWVRTSDCFQWDRSMSSYNLLERCFKDPPFLIDAIAIKRVRDIFIDCLYTKRSLIENQLTEFIIKELQTKAKSAIDNDTTKQVCSARGNLILQEDYFLISESLSPWTLEVDYDESLLIWHLATDICYRTSDRMDPTTNYDYRNFSKKLSDYMAYLLLRQEGLMSPLVGISDIRFEDTCAEARKFFKSSYSYCSRETCVEAAKRVISKLNGNRCNRPQNAEGLLSEFSQKVLQIKSVVKPLVAKGDKSKSVLFDACRLAKQLALFKDKQWEITTMVWIELLCYAAIRCTPRAHLARLNQGGELITLVWLSMAHLGLLERFQQNQGFGWTKLVTED